MKKLRSLYAVGFVLLTIIIGSSLVIGHGHAACGGIDQGTLGGIACGPQSVSTQTAVQRAINILLYITGISAVIVIIVGGLRYVLSGGDPKNTAAAKDTIMYAAIGLVVSLLAYAIVNFVLGQFR
ncbi:hypothetical protein IT415_02630 [bacterium]|nr:hypothetical protein [bacterium]